MKKIDEGRKNKSDWSIGIANDAKMRDVQAAPPADKERARVGEKALGENMQAVALDVSRW